MHAREPAPIARPRPHGNTARHQPTPPFYIYTRPQHEASVQHHKFTTMSNAQQSAAPTINLSLPTPDLFDPAVLAFAADGKLVGVDEQRGQQQQPPRVSLAEQQRQLEELRRKVHRDEARLGNLKVRCCGCLRRRSVLCGLTGFGRLSSARLRVTRWRRPERAVDGVGARRAGVCFADIAEFETSMCVGTLVAGRVICCEGLQTPRLGRDGFRVRPID